MEEQEVVKRGPRDGEGAQIVFPAHEIDPVFDTYSGVCLGEGGGGDAQQPDAAMGGGGGKACYVKKRSAAHGYDIGMAVNACFHNVAQGRFPCGKTCFGFLPARNGTAAGIGQHPGIFFKIAVNVCRKLRIKLFQPFFQENENAASGPLFHQAGQSIVFRAEGSMGKACPVGKIKPDIQRVKRHARRAASEHGSRIPSPCGARERPSSG